MLMWFGIAAAVFVAGALTYCLLQCVGVFRRYIDAIERPESAVDLGPLWDAIQQNASAARTLTQAVAEGIERVDRAERRIKNTVKRAQDRLESAGFEDPGLEAEAAGLSLVDDDVGRDDHVPDLSPPLAGARDTGPSPIPGVTMAEYMEMTLRVPDGN